MNEDAPKKPVSEIPEAQTKFPNAWQPFTPRGVAAFARASGSRVLFLKSVVALAAAVVVVWFFNTTYATSVSEAIRHLNDEAAFENGQLIHATSGVLTQKKFLSVVIDLEETGQSGQTSDLQIELRRKYFQACSLFGCGVFEYPADSFLIGRSTSEPWWGARKPILLVLCGVLAIAGVWLTWFVLALIYAPIAKVIAYFNDRELSWSGSWRLASAAQMTGALLMSLAILLYGLQVFDLIRFLFFFSAHFVVAWIYVGAAPLVLPAISTEIPPTKNPFE
ncbi:MAG: hypothetical protein ABIQ35_08850 [Verrucomicrobiota bacterium]